MQIQRWTPHNLALLPDDTRDKMVRGETHAR